MTNATDNKAVATKYRTNYALKILGHLGHDNKLFDRTCPQCKGMYSSYQISTCPKCNGALTYITTAAGKPIAISEGTVYPSFGPKQKQRDLDATNNRKNGMEAIYRFKIFAFADDNGVLGMPKDHHNLKRGAQVEIIIINHQAIPSFFQAKEGAYKVELMLMIYEQYGDTVKIISEPQASKNTTAMQVDATGAAIPTDTAAIDAEIAAINLRIEALNKASVIAAENTTTQTAVIPDNTVVINGNANDALQAVAEMEEPPFETDIGIDPFAAAL